MSYNRIPPYIYQVVIFKDKGEDFSPRIKILQMPALEIFEWCTILRPWEPFWSRRWSMKSFSSFFEEWTLKTNFEDLFLYSGSFKRHRIQADCISIAMIDKSSSRSSMVYKHHFITIIHSKDRVKWILILSWPQFGFFAICF